MIVVTGAAGFIGSNVVAAPNQRGQTDIAVCDWLGQDQRWMNLRKRMFRHYGGCSSGNVADHDAEFFRRLSLDLNGRIPSYSQLADFLDDTRKDRRRLWIDELMDGPDNAPLYVQHFTHFWRRQLLAQTPAQSDAVVAPLEGWLRKQLKANTPYDRMVRGLLTDADVSAFY